jgi:hypothetical protein
MSQVEDKMQEFLGVLETIENQLSIYDAALRFAKANHPREAQVFENCMDVVSQPGLSDVFASPELEKLRGKARELCVLAAQDLGNQSKL